MIIPAPYWVSYPDIALICDGKPVVIEAGVDQGFRITPQQLEAAITPRTKLFFINSPSNPTGAVYTARPNSKALGAVLRRHPQVLIATDDMYEHIKLDDYEFVNIVNVCPDLYDRTIVLNGVSKAYSMTGWRIGYCGGPQAIITAMENVQSQSTSNPTSISQVAAEAALTGDQSCIEPMVDAFRERHDYVYERAQRDARREVPARGRRVLRLSVRRRRDPRRCTQNGLIAAPTDLAFSRVPAREGAGRGRSGIGVRHRRLRPHFVCDVDGQPREGDDAHARGVARAGDRFELRIERAVRSHVDHDCNAIGHRSTLTGRAVTL